MFPPHAATCGLGMFVVTVTVFVSLHCSSTWIEMYDIEFRPTLQIGVTVVRNERCCSEHPQMENLQLI